MKPLKLLIGACVSLALAALTVSRVDVGSTMAALTRIALPALTLGLAFAWLEILVRAWRLRFVLSALGPISYPQSLAYTLVGAFGNLLLPARLGDVAKAYLAAHAVRSPKLAVLGSVAAERIVDGVTTIALAAVLGLTVPSLPPAIAATLPLGAAGVVALAAAALVLRRLWRGGHELGYLHVILVWLARLAPGARAMATAQGMVIVIVATLAAYCCAALALYSIAWGVGLRLTVLGAAFAMAWMALSTAVPAGQGSVGTYEFVGVTVLSALNQDPSVALAAVVLVHVVGTIPEALAGFIVTLALNVKLLSPTSPTSDETAEPETSTTSHVGPVAVTASVPAGSTRS